MEKAEKDQLIVDIAITAVCRTRSIHRRLVRR